MRKIVNLEEYDPKCKSYPKKQRGKVMYYVSYYLPNGKRMLRPVHQDFNEAKKLIRKKEKQLIRGIFDAKDHKKLGAYLDVRQSCDRLTIEDGLRVYFENTKSRKSSTTYDRDLSAINRCFDFFRNRGKRYFDEIKSLDVLNLITCLDEGGKAEPTIKNAVTMVRKVYNFLIDEAELISGKNPVPKKVKLPKKNGLVRDRLASDKEINKLLKAIQKDELSERQSNLPTSSISPLGNILQFLIFTGARRSEVLHAEWSDFDLIEGIWKIRIKPKCPTINGLGWYPKWKKPRDVILFPEALNLLRSIEKVETIGKVGIRDLNHKIVDHKIYPAQFIFPKKEFLKQEDGKALTRYSRVDSIQTGWGSLLKRAEVEDLQIKDLRTYFNHKLRAFYDFSPKEAGAYIGNSDVINDLHYNPISIDMMKQKMEKTSLDKLIGNSLEIAS